MNFAISYALLELLTALWAIRSITSVYYVDWLSILDCIHIELLEIVGPQPRELQLESQCRKNQEKNIWADMSLYVPIRPSVFRNLIKGRRLL